MPPLIMTCPEDSTHGRIHTRRMLAPRRFLAVPSCMDAVPGYLQAAFLFGQGVCFCFAVDTHFHRVQPPSFGP